MRTGVVRDEVVGALLVAGWALLDGRTAKEDAARLGDAMTPRPKLARRRPSAWR
jgi:hypothetical protein